MNLTKKSNDEQDKLERTKVRNIYVAEQIADPHKFTRKTQSAFEKIIKKVANVRASKTLPSDYPSIIKSIYRGRFVCRNTDCFHATVSEELVNRAIRLLDNLAKELENSKFRIKFTQDISGSFIVAVKDNEHISFNISEGYKYYPIQNEDRSELEKVLYRDRKPIPTGKLTLTILARETHINNSWSDGSKLIEDALPTIILGFERLVLRQKQRKIDNAMLAKQRKEEVRIFGEIQSRKYSEKTIYEEAMKEAKSFIAHRNLDEYLNYLEENYLKEFDLLDASTQSWLSTARKLAETQNPVSKRLKLIKNMRNSIE